MKVEKQTENGDKKRVDKKSNKVRKCKYCGGKGIIQIMPNIRGLEKCPFCNV